jgi:RNA polymerase sigma-70 factor (ECF subfamily)
MLGGDHTVLSAGRNLSVIDEKTRLEIRAVLVQYLRRLWRYGLILSGNRDIAEKLVQATCVRALDRAHQFTAGPGLDRWLLSILRSVWLNDPRIRRMRSAHGTVDAQIGSVFEGAAAMEMTTMSVRVLNEVQSLPQAARETLFLVYVEGLTYREAAEMLNVPIGTVMSRLVAAREVLGKLAAEQGSPSNFSAEPRSTS